MGLCVCVSCCRGAIDDGIGMDGGGYIGLLHCHGMRGGEEFGSRGRVGWRGGGWGAGMDRGKIG